MNHVRTERLDLLEQHAIQPSRVPPFPHARELFQKALRLRQSSSAEVVANPTSLQRNTVRHDFGRFVAKCSQVARVEVGGAKALVNQRSPLRIVRRVLE